MKVQFLLILLLLAFHLNAHEIDQLDFIEISSEKEWDEIFAKAQENNQLVFADAYTDWCGYCHKLDKEVYTDEKVIEYFEKNFINIKFDAESEFGYQLAQYYEIDSYPTLLFLSPERSVFMRIGGFVPAASLNAYAEESFSDWYQLPILTKSYETGELDQAGYLELINTLERSRPNKAEEVALKYAETLNEEDYKNLENIWFLTRFANTLNARHYQYITENKEQIIDWHGQNEFNDYMSGVYNDNLMLAIRYGDLEVLQKLTQEVLPMFVPKAELPSAQYVTESVYYAQREEFDNYKLAVNAYMNNHLSKNQKPDFIISTVVEIIENYQNEDLIAFAHRLLNQSIQIDEERFESFALLGYINGLMSEFSKAEANFKQSLNLAKGNEQRGFVNNLKEAVNMMKQG